MASIRKQIDVAVSARAAWAAVRDYGAVHQRVAPGFVVDARMDGKDRIVTFASGAQARERAVTIDDEHRRLVYTVVDGPLGATHHQASVEVIDGADGATGCTILWTTDVLPHDLAPAIDGLMDQGAAAMVRTLRADG